MLALNVVVCFVLFGVMWLFVIDCQFLLLLMVLFVVSYVLL